MHSKFQQPRDTRLSWTNLFSHLGPNISYFHMNMWNVNPKTVWLVSLPLFPNILSWRCVECVYVWGKCVRFFGGFSRWQCSPLIYPPLSMCARGRHTLAAVQRNRLHSTWALATHFMRKLNEQKSFECFGAHTVKMTQTPSLPTSLRCPRSAFLCKSFIDYTLKLTESTGRGLLKWYL